MNQAQFANVLIKSMPYYFSWQKGSPYMCHAINRSNCSEWEKKRAITKIEKLLYPNTTLYSHFVDYNFIYLGTSLASQEYQKKSLTFWAIQIALGKGYPSPAIEKLSSYLTHVNLAGWETAQQILYRYVK